MNKHEIINILLCFDDADWNYTRHVAVTIFSLLETNKKNKIKIYIMTSFLSQENINELKRIVGLYNQEIEFIISNNIVPEELKKVIINKRTLIRWPRYRYFFPKFIKWIDRILYMDCDVLVMKDISRIYNMDIKWKSIVWYYDIRPYSRRNKLFWIKNYINSWVLLFDVKKYDVSKINVNKMEEINMKYSKYFMWWDQDKINIIFEDDILLSSEWLNYQIINKRFNLWMGKAEIIHCLEKPYIKYSCIPKKLIDIYHNYLSKTKWRWYPMEIVENYWNCGKWYFGLICKYIYVFFFYLFWIIMGKISWKYHH